MAIFSEPTNSKADQSIVHFVPLTALQVGQYFSICFLLFDEVSIVLFPSAHATVPATASPLGCQSVQNSDQIFNMKFRIR